MIDGFDNKFIHARIRLKLDQMKNTTHRELLRLKQKWNPLLLQIVNLFQGTNFFTNSEFRIQCISRTLKFFLVWLLR